MKCIDTSDELIIQRWGNGIKLARPELSLSDSEHSITHVLNLPLNICFMNTEGVLQKTNEACATLCGASSVESLIGKSAAAVTDRSYAERLAANDRSVMQANNIKIFEEDSIIQHNEEYHQ